MKGVSMREGRAKDGGAQDAGHNPRWLAVFEAPYDHAIISIYVIRSRTVLA